MASSSVAMGTCEWEATYFFEDETLSCATDFVGVEGVQSCDGEDKVIGRNSSARHHKMMKKVKAHNFEASGEH